MDDAKITDYKGAFASLVTDMVQDEFTPEEVLSVAKQVLTDLLDLVEQRDEEAVIVKALEAFKTKAMVDCPRCQGSGVRVYKDDYDRSSFESSCDNCGGVGKVAQT